MFQFIVIAKGYLGAVLKDITESKKMEQGDLSVSLGESPRRKSEIFSSIERLQELFCKTRNSKIQHVQYLTLSKALIGATAGYITLLSKDGKENQVLFLDSGGLPCTGDPSLLCLFGDSVEKRKNLEK